MFDEIRLAIGNFPVKELREGWTNWCPVPFSLLFMECYSEHFTPVPLVIAGSTGNLHLEYG